MYYKIQYMKEKTILTWGNTEYHWYGENDNPRNYTVKL